MDIPEWSRTAICGFLSAGSAFFCDQAPADWWWKCNRHWLHMRSCDWNWLTGRQISAPPDVEPWGCWRLTVSLIGRFYLDFFVCLCFSFVFSLLVPVHVLPNLTNLANLVTNDNQPWDMAIPCPPPDRSWLPLEVRDDRPSGSIGM